MLPDGSVEFDRFDYHRRAVESEKEAFFLRISRPGDYRYEGCGFGYPCDARPFHGQPVPSY